jgi:ATP-binding protein involved in chromosome partitioning
MDDFSSFPRNRRLTEDGFDGFHNEQIFHKNLSEIHCKILVLSGKGGVGKTTIAVNLASSLSKNGYEVGILEADVKSPNIPNMLHLEKQKAETQNYVIQPILFKDVKIMSSSFYPENSVDDYLKKVPSIKDFFNEVQWGNLDFLVIDAPPGIDNETAFLCDLVKLDGAIIVTTPQEIALSTTKNAIRFCRKLEVPILGIVENMNALDSPNEKKSKKEGIEAISIECEVPFLGRFTKDSSMEHGLIEETCSSENITSFKKIADRISKSFFTET